VWAEAGSKNYRLVLSLGCFCSAGRYEVVVRSDHVASVVPLDARKGEIPQALLPRYGVAELFGIAARRDYDSVDVEYDPRNGYPRRLAVDAERSAIDDEFTITVLSYAPAPDPA
jgi:hypothetical protein